MQLHRVPHAVADWQQPEADISHTTQYALLHGVASFQHLTQA